MTTKAAGSGTRHAVLVFASWAFASTAAHAQIPAIQHVVIVTQENRSVDNLFHSLPAVLPQADVATTGRTSTGQTVPLVPISLQIAYDMSHAFVQFHTQYDNGRMDGADLVTCTASPGATCPNLPAYAYVLPSQAQPYVDMAVAYGFANRMFQTNRGPSLPAHLELLSGSGEPVANSNLEDSNILNGPVVQNSGCTAPTGSALALIGPSGAVVQNVFPCFEHATLIDLLQAPPRAPSTPISWRYYTPITYGVVNATNAIRHLCQPGVQNGAPVCTSPFYTDGHVVSSPPQLLRDIAAGNLASVTWINPPTASSDHAIGCNDTGPSWVSAIVNTIGQSAFWQNTVILVTWDDWGGWYDHVAPPNDSLHGYYEYGFRVPLLVISPYAKPGYVSPVIHHFGSILKFVETVFDTGLIPPGNFSDSRADDLRDFFDFNAAPRPFTPISAPYPVSYFLALPQRPLARGRDVDD